MTKEKYTSEQQTSMLKAKIGDGIGDFEITGDENTTTSSVLIRPSA
jgi:hypothetical protein